MLKSSMIVIGFLFLIISIGFAEETSVSANALYKQGKYQEALELLQKDGLKSAADYYNAGNCLYRLGKPGQALSYFEKANHLSPGNEDIQYNIRLSEEALHKTGSLAKDQSFWSGKLVPALRHISEEFVDLLLALTTIGIALVAYRSKKQSLQLSQAVVQPGFLIAVGLWALTGALATATVMAHRMQLAAVVADLGVARSGPAETFTELFKVPAGTKLQLTGQEREGWRQVRFSLGNVGWIRDKDLLPL